MEERSEPIWYFAYDGSRHPVRNTMTPPQPPSDRHNELVSEYRELRLIAHSLVGSFGSDRDEKIIAITQTLALIDLKKTIEKMPRSTDKVTERVLVGDIINERMSEVYK